MLAAALGVTACPVALAEEAPVQPELVARVKNIIEADGYQFKDLNDNGALDPYEDWRLTPEERAEDLLSQMDATQKASQMAHLTLVSKKDSWFNENNVGFALVYEYIFDSATEAAKRTNEIQELSESAPLGIPVIFSMDTEAGAAYVKDATFLPDEINQGAVNDPELVTRLNQVLKEELMAAGVRSTRQLVEGVDEERLTDACRRILIAKFQLGIFENPYVDEENAAQVLGSEEHRAVAKEAAARSFTLLKYENASPLAGQKLVVAGTLAEDVRALNSGWTAKDPMELAGTTILEAFQNKAGSENVTYIPDASQVPADLSGTTAVVVIGEASGTHEPAWGTDTLEFPQEQVDLVKALKDAGANVVEVVLMNRAYVMTDMVDMADSVLLAYRPGVTCGAEAIADALFGETAITGKTPFQIPRTMEQALNQREDLPKDIQDPLFEYGFGLEVESFGA